MLPGAVESLGRTSCAVTTSTIVVGGFSFYCFIYFIYFFLFYFILSSRRALALRCLQIRQRSKIVHTDYIEEGHFPPLLCRR